MEDRLLRIYMTDHLAWAYLPASWRAARSARPMTLRYEQRSPGSPKTESARTSRFYKQMMRRLGLSPRSPKIALAVAGERLGRAKLNGRLGQRSPLSSFQELDVLIMAIENKIVLRENLRDLAGLRDRLPDIDFDHLTERARAQRAELEPFRIRWAASRSAGTRSTRRWRHLQQPDNLSRGGLERREHQRAARQQAQRDHRHALHRKQAKAYPQAGASQARSIEAVQAEDALDGALASNR